MSFFTNNRWLAVITLLLLTANIVTLGFLWTHKSQQDQSYFRPASPPPQGQVFEFIVKELQLDSVQQITYKKLREAHQAGQIPLQDSIRKTKEALFELLKSPTVTDAAIQEASSKSAAADAQLELFTFRHFQQLRAICNTTQQKKFDEIIQDVLKRMAMPHGKKQQGPPPGDSRSDTLAPGKNKIPNNRMPLPQDEEDRRPPPPEDMRGERPPPPPGERRPPPPPGERPPGDRRLPPPPPANE